MRIIGGVHIPVLNCSAEPSRNDVRRQLILDEGNSVAQTELAFFQALNLDNVGPWGGLQRFDRSVKIAMLLPQPLELCLQLDFFFFGHSQPPNFNALSRPEQCLTSPRTRPKILPANTTIDPTMLPESLPRDQVA
jgi:hypothetical protein